MQTIFKVFVESATLLLLSYVLDFFGHETYRILTPCPGIKLTAPALEGKVLTTGLRAKFLVFDCLSTVPTYLLKLLQIFL